MNNSKSITKKKSDQELITIDQADTICEQLVNGLSLGEILGDKQYPFSLMKFYGYLKKNPELEIRILEARKMGVQTLIDKLMQIFSLQEVENPNQILWIREKTKFVQFLASKLTDLYSDNKPTQVKSDQNINIKFDSGFDSLEAKEIEGVFETTPPINKGTD
jgi:hypothetical protein